MIHVASPAMLLFLRSSSAQVHSDVATIVLYGKRLSFFHLMYFVPPKRVLLRQKKTRPFNFLGVISYFSNIMSEVLGTRSAVCTEYQFRSFVTRFIGPKPITKFKT